MSFSSSYSLIDRGLHHVAFGAPIVQKMLSELESDLFKRELEAVASQGEVFVTGLPRAGTTLMLELLYATGEFATYTYRDMPFVLAPLLWSRLSRPFRRAGVKQERAHGDGMQISFDSPEAFEEVVWLAYLADRIVRGDTLATVSAGETTEELRAALERSVRKIVALAAQGAPAGRRLRYLSKNNANISRIDALLELFPTCQVLVVFRNPASHVGSLARQHERFLAEHASDPFSRKYMQWIGHYEFGANLKPINFGDWLRGAELPARVDETFWIRYWNAAYSYALERRTDRVHLVDFDGLLRDGAASLGRIAKAVALERPEALAAAAETLRAPTTRPGEAGPGDPEAWNRALSIHDTLKSLAV